MQYSSTAASPMIITDAKIPKDDGVRISDYWGHEQRAEESSINFQNIPACFGNKKPLNTYFVQNVDKGAGLPTLPDIMNDLHVYNMVNGDENPITNWEYRPQVCVLKSSKPYPYYRNYVNNKSTAFLYGNKVPFSSIGYVTIDDDHYGQTMNPAVNHLPKKSVNIPYTSSIEQCGSIMYGFNEYAGGLQPPSLHVGVLTINAYSTEADESAVQEVIAIYKETTSCEIQYSYDFTHTYGTYVHPVMKVMGNTDVADIGKESYIGEFVYDYRGVSRIYRDGAQLSDWSKFGHVTCDVTKPRPFSKMAAPKGAL